MTKIIFNKSGKESEAVMEIAKAEYALKYGLTENPRAYEFSEIFSDAFRRIYPPINIEIGKTYVSREGIVFGPVVDDSREALDISGGVHQSSGELCAIYNGMFSRSYWSNGYARSGHWGDAVAEVLIADE